MLEHATSESAAGQKQEQVAADDADVAGDRGGRKADASLCDEQSSSDERQVFADQRRERQQQQDRQQGRTGPLGNDSGIEVSAGSAEPVGIRSAAQRCGAVVDATQEVVDLVTDDVCVPEDEEVTPIQHDQLALGHQAVMLERGLTGDERVVLAVDDEKRLVDGLEDAT